MKSKIEHRTARARLRPFMAILVCCLFLGSSFIADAEAQRLRRRKKKKKAPPIASVKEVKSKRGKDQIFDFTGLTLGASMRTPQLLYFLDRASEELQRASLQRRSDVPEMVRSIDEEGLRAKTWARIRYYGSAISGATKSWRTGYSTRISRLSWALLARPPS